MSEETFWQEYTLLSDRRAAKLSDLAAARAELASMTAELLDADPVDRPGLIAKRADLQNLVDALSAEYALLSTRRDTAYLSAYEAAELAAAESFRAAQAKANIHRREITAAMEEQRRFGFHPTADRLEQFKAIEGRVATLRAEGYVLTAQVDRLKLLWDQAKNETAAARASLGKT